jgi:hypothetical protein
VNASRMPQLIGCGVFPQPQWPGEDSVEKVIRMLGRWSGATCNRCLRPSAATACSRSTTAVARSCALVSATAKRSRDHRASATTPPAGSPRGEASPRAEGPPLPPSEAARFRVEQGGPKAAHDDEAAIGLARESGIALSISLTLLTRVVLPPGRARLATKPGKRIAPTHKHDRNRARLLLQRPRQPHVAVTRTSGLRSTSALAYVRTWSEVRGFHRASTLKLRPFDHPSSASPSKNAATKSFVRDRVHH